MPHRDPEIARQRRKEYEAKRRKRLADDPGYAARRKEQQRKARLAFAERNPDYMSEYMKRYWQDSGNYEKHKQRSREQWERIKADPALLEAQRETVRRSYYRNREARLEKCRRQELRRYRLTVEQYDEMLKQQGGLCAICHRPPCETHADGRRLAVDHDATTGQVRALLCGSCNRGIGLFQEDPARIAAAIRYLEKHDNSTTS